LAEHHVLLVCSFDLVKSSCNYHIKTVKHKTLKSITLKLKTLTD
jgi:hypothetical protein